MSENNASYIELKTALKEKYKTMFLDMLKSTKIEYITAVKDVLGENYLTFRQDLISVEEQIYEKRNEFLNGEEYLTAKQKMAEAKLKLDLSKEEEKEDNEIEFQKTLSNISTLNTKLNNVLKDFYKKQEDAKFNLKTLFDENKDKLVEVKTALELKTKTAIYKIMLDFSTELKELNETFGVTLAKPEMPFSDDIVKTNDVYTDFEKEYFNGGKDSLESEIPSDTKIEIITTSDIIDDKSEILN